MRRPLLITLMALGLVTSLTGASGVLAASTDRATTGTNSLTSGARPSAVDVDVQIATWNRGTGACGTFAEDLTTGLFTVTDVQPSSGSIGMPQSLCLKNAGTGSVDLTAAVIDVVSTDVGCTGDEAAVDATCGGDKAGELEHRVLTTISRWSSCAANAPAGGAVASGYLSGFATPTPLSLAEGATACLAVNLTFLATDAQAEATQSDRVTWRYAFDAVQTP